MTAPADRGRGWFPASLASQRGASFVAIVFAMAIAAGLYFAYFQMQGTISDQKVGIASIEASRGAACRTNRQTIERQIPAWFVEHDDPPSLDDLDAEFGPLPGCPEGGELTLAGSTVHCSKHP